MSTPRLRALALVVHRYVGLALTVFLVVAGLTGTILVFREELDRSFAASLLTAQPPFLGAPLLDPFELAARVERALPEAQRSVHFDVEPGIAVSMWIEVEPGEWKEAFVNPYTGQLLGTRTWGDLREGWVNLVPFLYRLHYSLALGDLGIILFGIAALLWTLDCFVGGYLTLPAPERRPAAKKVSFFVRWLPSWLVRTNRTFSLVFTWHRASGLWVWAILLVFAWSAVGLNLNDVYRPIMQASFGMHESVHDQLPQLRAPFEKPGITLQEAHALGKRFMAEEASARDFRILREVQLYHAAEHGAFVYGVESTLDVSTKYPRTEVSFDARDGRFVGFDAASGISTGGTITSWLYGLHFAAVGGLWYRLFVAVLGILVAILSVTGVWIWWVKRAKRVRAAAGRRERVQSDPPSPVGAAEVG